MKVLDAPLAWLIYQPADQLVLDGPWPREVVFSLAKLFPLRVEWEQSEPCAVGHRALAAGNHRGDGPRACPWARGWTRWDACSYPLTWHLTQGIVSRTPQSSSMLVGGNYERSEGHVPGTETLWV